MSPELLFLTEQLQEAYEKVALDLVQGSLRDIGEYRYHTGIARGYMLAKGMIVEIARKLDKDETDEDYDDI